MDLPKGHMDLSLPYGFISRFITTQQNHTILCIMCGNQVIMKSSYTQILIISVM